MNLFWRFFISYLLVIFIGGLTLYFASELFTPLLIERHVHHLPTRLEGEFGPEFELLLADLDDAYHSTFNQSLLWGGLAALLIAGGLALFVTSQVVAPLRRMEEVSQRMASGDYHERLNVSAPGEIGELAASFNAMAEALETSEARRVELISNVAHEFRTPLSSLRGYIEGLSDGIFLPESETYLACQRQVGRLERLVDDLSLLSAMEDGESSVNFQTMRVADLLEQLKGNFKPQFVAKGVDLRLEMPSDELAVLADHQRTGQVLSNLVSNALRHTEAGGEVKVWSAIHPGELVFHIADTGEGIAKDVLPHIFKRFFRADKARALDRKSGSGIGLTIAKHFVEAQGGRIGASSMPGKGSHFWFSLPAAD